MRMTSNRDLLHFISLCVVISHLKHKINTFDIKVESVFSFLHFGRFLFRVLVALTYMSKCFIVGKTVFQTRL